MERIVALDWSSWGAGDPIAQAEGWLSVAAVDRLAGELVTDSG